MTLALIVIAALTASIALLWAIGAREPVYAISEGDGPHWFVALRGEAGALAPDVTQRWASAADFALIGADDAYWHRFAILSGGDAEKMPIALDRAEDAFVARVKLRRPPKPLLGLLKLLIALGVLNGPSGDIVQDAQALEFRSDVMPGADAIAALLAKPGEYSPAMVNFLAYRAQAQYSKPRREISGAAAYLRYGMVALRTVYRTGGHLLFTGRIVSILREAKAGPCAGRWDDVAAMRYPNPPAILSMEHAPDYRAALHHRDAGLERTVVIASTPT
jgi:uncharacterized protein (DUF1330 family)